MNFFLVLVLLLSSACSTRKPGTSPFAKELRSLSESHLELRNACIKQEDEVLSRAISEVISKKDKDVHYSFPEKESEALKYLQSFEYSKIDHKSENQYFEFYLKNCSPDSFQDYNEFHLGRRMCSGVFVEYKFFQGLIYGLANYKWSGSTKNLGKSVLRDYLKNLSTEKSYFISILLGISLIQDMGKHGLLPKKNLQAMQTVVHELETKRIEFEAEMRLQPPKDCADEVKRYEDEKKLGVYAGEKLDSLVKENF